MGLTRPRAEAAALVLPDASRVGALQEFVGRLTDDELGGLQGTSDHHALEQIAGFLDARLRPEGAAAPARAPALAPPGSEDTSYKVHAALLKGAATGALMGQGVLKSAISGGVDGLPQPLPCKLPLFPATMAKLRHEWTAADAFFEEASEETASALQLMTRLYLALEPISECRGEAGLHAPIDARFRDLWQPMGPPQLSFARDPSDPPSATEGPLRPDFMAYLGNVLVMKGEEKCDMNELHIAIHELRSKSAPWSPHIFVGVDYITAFAAAGRLLRLCTLSRSLALDFLHTDAYDLRTMKDRAVAVVASIHMLRAVCSFECVMPHQRSRMMPLKEYERANGVTIWLGEDCFGKSIDVFMDHFVEHRHLTRWEYVQKAYDIAALPTSVGLVRPLKKPCIKDSNRYRVLLELGYDSMPRSEGDLFDAVTAALQGLSALHLQRLVHRDVRWANIVRCVPDSRSPWMLVDLETVWQADEEPLCNFRVWDKTRPLFDRLYTTGSDLRLVAALAASCGAVELGQEGSQFVCELKRCDKSDSAADALSWQSYLAWKEQNPRS